MKKNADKSVHHKHVTSRNAIVIKLLFILVALTCLWPRIDAVIALAVGIIFSLVLTNPFPDLTNKWSTILMQMSVVGLGFGIGISKVIHEGSHSLIYTMIGITLTILIGKLIGSLLKVNSNISQLISFGTAICGGSAIAAMAPVIKAKDEERGVSFNKPSLEKCRSQCEAPSSMSESLP